MNVGKKDYIKKKNKFMPAIRDWIEKNGGGQILPYSAEFEREVLNKAGSIDEEACKKAAKSLGAKSMITKIVHAGYKAL